MYFVLRKLHTNVTLCLEMFIIFSAPTRDTWVSTICYVHLSIVIRLSRIPLLCQSVTNLFVQHFSYVVSNSRNK